MILKRRLSLDPQKNWLLLGPRRVGKSTFLHGLEGTPVLIDLLKTDVYFDYRSRPALLREQFAGKKEFVVIDEVQRIPDLLSEVHWLIENTENRFLLTGSSARKLRREGVSNLAGRLKAARMHPLTFAELPDFDLGARLQYVLLPPVVFSQDPWSELKDYSGEYLREEVQAESIVRNIPAFARFLETSALSNGELLNFTTIARDCGVSSKTCAEWFQILIDTLVGFYLVPYTRTKKRRAIFTPKFYFFDTGMPNILLRRRLSEKTPEFGRCFEHFLIMETIAAQSYNRRIETLNYWRSASGIEVDLLIDESIAVEFKSGQIHPQDAKGLFALSEDLPLKAMWIVGREERPRILESGVEILPWREYLGRISAL
jgi:uncharacterized protein